MFWRSEGPDDGPVNEVERALHGVDVTWNSRKAYPYPIGRGGRLAEEVQPGGLGCREDLDDGDGGNGDALVILNRVGELIDASEVGRRRINDVCARERHRAAIGAIGADVADQKDAVGVLGRPGQQLVQQYRLRTVLNCAEDDACCDRDMAEDD